MSYSRNLARLARTGAPTVDTAQALRDMPIYGGLYPERVQTLGALAAGDGGGGGWRWDASSTADDNLGTVLLPTGHVGAGRWVRCRANQINARWFGARGDGATDDTAALQSAADSGAASVLVEDGRYVTTGLAVTRAGQHWVGPGELLAAPGSNSTAVTISASDVVWSVGVDGNRDTQTGAPSCIYVQSAQRVRVRDCYIRFAAGTGVLVVDAPYSVIERCEIAFCNAQCVTLHTGSSRSVIRDNYIHDSANADCVHVAYGAGRCNYVQILGNRVEYSATNGAYFGAGIRITGGQYATCDSNVCLNHAHGSGIVYTATAGNIPADNGVVVNNTCNDSLNGIIMDNLSSNCTVANNSCCENVMDGIDVNDSTDWVIANNVCNDNGEKGILLWGARRGQMVGNVCKRNNTRQTNANDSGINVQKHPTRLVQSEDVTIMGNTCSDPRAAEDQTQAYGIRIIDLSEDVRCINNDVRFNVIHGINDATGQPIKNPKRANRGYRTEAYDNVLVPAGSTQVNVVAALDGTAVSIQALAITPNGPLSADNAYWADNLTPTSFRINMKAAETYDTYFRYLASVYATDYYS